ncbi:STAS domain-containing protein [Synechococcus sp. UW179B]|jgi:anti-anti-sigma factor|uniref:STAS domain-containing protein n=1 Tax=Synechococcus sp. UW179B TaxID=2575516 RepID=UPI000E0FE988|nr:STAS domain-containing protein [Synechococcus sp. UW179B]
MTLQISSTINDSEATIKLVGTVDTKTAPDFLQNLTSLDLPSLTQLKIDMSEMSFMSSAGLRALLFAKQKMNQNSNLTVCGANEGVVDTIQKTGLSQAIVISES